MSDLPVTNNQIINRHDAKTAMKRKLQFTAKTQRKPETEREQAFH
jgi:hypothetical protein